MTINTSSLYNNSAVNHGGAILNDGRLTVNRTSLDHNTTTGATGSGGALYHDGTSLYITNSTIATNTATSGGGVYFATTGGIVTNSTIAYNTVSASSGAQGGGVYAAPSIVPSIYSTILATNTATGSGASGPDVFGTISSGSNLIDNTAGASGFTSSDLQNVVAQLGPLGLYGGSTKSVILNPNSLAIGKGNCLFLPSDQRGVGRKNNGDYTGCDIGAFESYSFTPTTLSPTPINTFMNVTLIASGGIAPYTYHLTSGSMLPIGLTLSSTGTLYGTPTKGGVYTFTVQVSDSLSDLDTGAYTLSVIGAKDTIGVFRPSAGTFFLRKSNTTGYADYTLPFGNATSLPVAGDWNGDGIDTVGYVDSTTGSFALTNGTLPNSSVDYTLTFGNPGDRPFSGHWSITSAADGVGVYRGTNGILYIKSALVTGFADYAMVLGNPGDLPVAGDWTGKGFDSVGIYRSGASSFYLSNELTNGNITADITVPFGSGTALPIAGDWTGSGYASLALYNNGVFTTKNYPYNGSTSDNTFAFGGAGDLPVAGVWGAGNGNTANPVHTVPPTILIPKTATPIAPTGSNGSAPGGNQIGG